MKINNISVQRRYVTGKYEHIEVTIEASEFKNSNITESIRKIDDACKEYLCTQC